MVILAALGGVALIVTKLGKNSMNIQGEAQESSEYADLAREAHFLISDPDSCRATLQGKKIKLGQSPIINNLEIWSAGASANEKGVKKISPGKLNKLEIGSISLTFTGMTKEIVRPGTHTAKGEFKVTGIKSIGAPEKSFSDLKHSLHLTVVTDAFGETSIINCERYEQGSTEQARVWCGSVSNGCVPTGVNIMGIGKYIDGKFSGVVHALDSVTILNCPAFIDQPATLNVCGER